MNAQKADLVFRTKQLVSLILSIWLLSACDNLDSRSTSTVQTAQIGLKPIGELIFLTELASINTAAGDESFEGIQCNYYPYTYHYSFEHQTEAQSSYQQALGHYWSIYNAASKPQSRLEILLKIGYATAQAGNIQLFNQQYPEAQNSYQKALETYWFIYNTAPPGSNLQNQALANIGCITARTGAIYSSQKQYAEALKLYQKSLDYYWEVDQKSTELEEQNFKSAQAILWNNLGVTYRHLNDVDKSQTAYKEALSICQEANSCEEINYNLGFLNYKLGDNESALNYLFSALSSAESNCSKTSRYYSLIGEIYEAHQQYEAALNYYVLAERSDQVRAIARLYRNQNQYYRSVEIDRLADWIDSDYYSSLDKLLEIGQNYQGHGEYEIALNYYILSRKPDKIREIEQIYSNMNLTQSRNRIEQIERIANLVGDYKYCYYDYAFATDASILIDEDENQNSKQDQKDEDKDENQNSNQDQKRENQNDSNNG